MVVKKQWKFCSISVGHFQAKRTNDILFFKAFIVHTKKICLKKGVDILRLIAKKKGVPTGLVRPTRCVNTKSVNYFSLKMKDA
jgi:hypothetical protein